ncbi:hypothetical protein TanjilG_22051 [Lupinus angustifolius]|uniref:Uncharacterized protein n=1 Tax=Lupinus angustifolius TaxID=3871 RepID=A0A4P1QU96_LUPAN|nr:hypothetical protein TanjilG_22051 [Lupinus angustifolius]
MKFIFQMLLSQLHLLILWCFVIAIIFQHVCAVSLPNNETVPAVIVFGDSIVDPGNNNNISTVIKCNFLPYGRDFAGGNRPTGRFSNGLVPSDIIAAKFGVKKLLPAYLDPNLQLQDLLTGVSFASGGAGYDPLTSKLAELYGVGARRIGVMGLPVIGCVPSQRTASGGIHRTCSDSENHAAIIFNIKLFSLIHALKLKFPEAKLVYLDIYTPLLNMIQNPSKYGNGTQ